MLEFEMDMDQLAKLKSSGLVVAEVTLLTE
jgi:hypothetical protein